MLDYGSWFLISSCFFVNFVVQFVGIKIVNEKSTKVIPPTADKGSKLTIQLMDSFGLLKTFRFSSN